MTVCEIFFKLKFSKFIQNIRTQNVFGKFLLIVIFTPRKLYMFLNRYVHSINGSLFFSITSVGAMDASDTQSEVGSNCISDYITVNILLFNLHTRKFFKWFLIKI